MWAVFIFYYNRESRLSSHIGLCDVTFRACCHAPPSSYGWPRVSLVVFSNAASIDNVTQVVFGVRHNKIGVSPTKRLSKGRATGAVAPKRPVRDRW